MVDRGGLACGRRREFSSSSSPLVQSSRSRPWLGYGLARVEENTGDNHSPKSIPTQERQERTRIKESDHAVVTEPRGHTHCPLQHTFFDSILDDYRPKSTTKRADENQNSAGSSGGDEQPSPRYNERMQTAISRILGHLLGSGHDWNDAVDSMVTHAPPIMSNDDTRDVMESPSVAKLVEMLPSEQQATTQQLFRLYRDLPSPGVAYLSKYSRGVLLRRFANPPNRRPVDARRYLALVEDMKSAGLPMSRALWSSAIYMAGRMSNTRVSKQRLVQAIGLWQQMEHLAGIEADDVVFTTLFDMAIKANQFVVARRIELEMEKRNIRFQRWGLVSKIFSCGVQNNAIGVRDNFDAFVSSGELVDTVVLNCAMSSFLRAGDIITAKSLYAKMLDAQRAKNQAAPKRANLEDPTAPLSTEFSFYRAKTKQLGKMLKESKHLRKRLPAFHQALQDSLPMTPDTRTFYIWLHHCARRSGNLKMFMQVVEDMERTFTLPPRHMIYLLLFEGFSLHGRSRRTTPQWTRQRLRLTWLGFIRAVRDSRARQLGLYKDSTQMTWNNPLRSVTDSELGIEPDITSDSPEKPDELYIPLPSTSSETPTPALDRSDQPKKSLTESVSESTLDQEDDLLEEVDFLAENQAENDFLAEDESEEGEFTELSGIPQDTDEALETLENNFNVRELTTEQEMDLDRQNVEYLESRLENGVFIGRRMAIAILRAFGTCYGPNEVMEAWLQLEALWPASTRTALDMIIVREVVEEEMTRKNGSG